VAPMTVVGAAPLVCTVLPSLSETTSQAMSTWWFAVMTVRLRAKFTPVTPMPAARNFELTELQAKIGQIAKNKSNPVLLVCQTGQQSQKASRIVSDAGYAEVHVLQGGLDAWQKAGMPVVKQGAVK